MHFGKADWRDFNRGTEREWLFANTVTPSGSKYLSGCG